MPKVIIEFNLPDEQHEYDEVMKASNYSHCLWSFDQEFLRANIKHGIAEYTVTDIMNIVNSNEEVAFSRDQVEYIAEATFQYIRDKLYEYMNSNNANPFN